MRTDFFVCCLCGHYLLAYLVFSERHLMACFSIRFRTRTSTELAISISVTHAARIFDAGFTGQQFRELRTMHCFEGIATWDSRHLTVTGHDVPENAIAFFGIGEASSTLGVPPLLGHNLGPFDSPRDRNRCPS